MKRILQLAALLFLTCSGAFAQGNGSFHDVAWRFAQGFPNYPAPGATVTVCNYPVTNGQIPCTNLATIYGGPTNTPVMSNPITADQNGNYAFWASPGNYVITITGANTIPYAATITVSGSSGNSAFFPLTVASSATPNFSSNLNTAFSYTLNQNVTSSTFTTNPGGGSTPVFQFNICENGTGGFTMTWPANVTLPTNYVLNTSPNACSPVAFIYNATLAQWTPWNNFQSIPSLPFSTTPFSATPTFNGTVNSAYGITLTGNVTSSSVTGVPLNGNVMKLHICQGAGSPWTFAFPTNFLNTTAIQTSGCTDETFSFDGTNWSQLTQPAGGGGGGGNCSSSGAQGTVQAAGAAGACQPTNLSEAGGVLSNSDTNNNRGPNPSVDITAFNASVQNPNTIPLTTGTITSGTNSLSVASASGWQKNNGLALVGGGLLNCSTAPIAPTGFPALAASATGTGYSVAGPTGSTSVSYTVVAVSKGGCYTAASPVLTISNSFNTLGPNSMAVTSQTNVNGTVTVTVGSTANLAVGTYFRISGTLDPVEFDGYHIISAVTSGTTFTYDTGMSSLYGMKNTTLTGGTLFYWTSNHLTLPALPSGTNMYKEVVLRCIGASCALPANAANYSPVYVSYPLNLGYTDATYGTWDDYGTTMSPTLSGNSYPWFLPTTAPSTNVNDMLVTTVTNISGTNFTLATNAVNSTSSAPVRFDNAPTISACVAASNTTNTGGGGTCHLPPPVESTSTGNYCYVVSSYLSLSGNILLGAPLCVGETLDQGSANLIGTYEDSPRMVQPAFAPASKLQFTCQGANPCIWRRGGTLKDLSISVGVNAIGVFDSLGNNATLTSGVNFNTNQSSTDYMSILYYFYNDVPGTGLFGGHFTDTSWVTGPSQVIGSTSTPLFLSKNGSEWTFDYFTGSRRGFYFETNSANTAAAYFISMKQGNEIQGPITPLVTLNNAGPGGNRSGFVYLEHFIDDSGAEPIVSNASSLIATISAPVFLNGSFQVGNGFPLVTGNHLQSVFAPDAGVNGPGVNTNTFICGGVFATAGCHTAGFNENVGVGSGNHTLIAGEGGWVSTGTGTVTVDCTLNGQEWDVYSQLGTTTLACNSGSLYGNNSVGPFVIPNGSGVHVTVDGGGNAHATGGSGGGGGGSPGGSTNAIQYNAGGGAFGGFNPPTIPGNYVCGYTTPTSTSVSPTCPLPGVPVNAQVGTTYTIGAANYWNDRATVITATNGSAQTYTMVNPTTTNFGANMPYSIWNRGTAAVTENASGFTVNGGASLLIPPNWVAPHWSDSVNWFAARYPSFEAWPNCVGAGNALQFTSATGAFSCGASSSGVSSLTGDGALITNSASTGVVTLTLGTAGAHKVWMNNTGSTATPGYQSIGEADLPATTVFTDKAATFGAFLYDFSASTIKVPTGAGVTASATNMIAYDTTNKNLHVYANNADSINCSFGSAPTNNNVVIATVASSNVLCTGVTALPNGTTATTQAVDDNSTNLATTAYVDRLNLRSLGWAYGDVATGSALTTSEVGYITVPFACTITGYHIMADAGTVTIKTARVNGGTALPTLGSNSISTSGVSLSSGTKVDSNTVTDFTSTAIAANDTLGFFITAVATAKQITFQLDCKQ